MEGVKPLLAVDLPQSDDCFVMAFPAETTEAFLEGHNHAFAYFGGVPRTILYDNSKLAVARILGDGTRMKTRAFTELQSHYLFAEKFGRPGKGNDKGKVEGLVGYARRNFMVPRPRYATWEEFNAHLLVQCRTAQRNQAAPADHGERFRKTRDAAAVASGTVRPATSVRPRVTSMALVCYRAKTTRCRWSGTPRSAGERVRTKSHLRGQRGDRAPSRTMNGRHDPPGYLAPWRSPMRWTGRAAGWLGSTGRLRELRRLWKRAWARRANASTCRRCGCWRRSTGK